ncbi:pentapeptide repeat-containing protein [Corynebacterium pseudodiphtheriticum]|uniref:pentapeptide repeat-containing protein n=1 Tax=Corynebacterium pseudodiphtheriticum TaxID=37637 RepID=UPI001EF5F7A3|nr:pentapeptide repeat-containing protein [Corynebacterium pseudodiphtheriticum]MCG7251856.1 pentapeptide repeat-containing protein [Corynebacterium pseudodiphtheriticum]MDK4340333.1 pentapeptide repeat-containing protein [Corynebacterium pseudodiphtheriticum]
MGYGKNTPSEENTPKDASPKEQDALDKDSSIENYSGQGREVAENASGTSPDHSSGDSPKPEVEPPLKDRQWFRRWFRDIVIPIIVSIVVGSLLTFAQIYDSKNQADTAERLENLRYVRDRAQVATPANLSPRCLGTGGSIFTPDTPTTNSSTDKPDPSIPELPFKDFDLKEQNLSGLWLNCANFSGANLEGADLSSAFLIKAKFNGANLKNADLRYANLELAQLGGADLRNADLREANLLGTPTHLSTFENANLQGTLLPEDNLTLTQQQKQRLQDLGAIFAKKEDTEP